jgi:hypothetical protein
MKFKPFTFVRYDGKNVILLDKFTATSWIACFVTKTGLIKSLDGYLYEQDIEEIIEPIMNIKLKELERLKIYHNDFVEHYNDLKRIISSEIYYWCNDESKWKVKEDGK